MPYPIEKKFVVAVSSSALFDMRESNEIFVKSGVEVYRKYQTSLIDTPLEKVWCGKQINQTRYCRPEDRAVSTDL